MESLKKCFKCGAEKVPSCFYKHGGMADGRLGKCKECTKTDVKENYLKNILSKEYVEKERARGREKYERLNYVSFPRKNADILNVTKTVRKKLDRHVDIDTYEELHHWNYNLPYDVFILGRREHKRIHQGLHLTDLKVLTVTETGAVLDTKEKHLSYINSVLGDEINVRQFILND